MQHFRLLESATGVDSGVQYENDDLASNSMRLERGHFASYQKGSSNSLRMLAKLEFHRICGSDTKKVIPLLDIWE